MTSHRRRVYAVLVVAALATVATGYLSRARANQEEELRSQERELADLQAREKVLTARRWASANRGKVAAPAASKISPRAAKESQGVFGVITHDPAAQNRYFAYMRKTQMIEYGAFLRTLHLTPDQLAQFSDNLARHKEDWMDTCTVLNDRGISLQDPLVGTLWQQEEAKYTAEQTAVLGVDGYQQLKSYDQATPARSMVATFAGAATLAGIPPSSSQLAQLNAVVTQAYVVESSAFRPMDEIDWPAVDARAAEILTPDQAAFFKTTDTDGVMGWSSRYRGVFLSLLVKADTVDVNAAPAH